jgi:hypothetical protein
VQFQHGPDVLADRPAFEHRQVLQVVLQRFAHVNVAGFQTLFVAHHGSLCG